MQSCWPPNTIRLQTQRHAAYNRLPALWYIELTLYYWGLPCGIINIVNPCIGIFVLNNIIFVYTRIQINSRFKCIQKFSFLFVFGSVFLCLSHFTMFWSVTVHRYCYVDKGCQLLCISINAFFKNAYILTCLKIA